MSSMATIPKRRKSPQQRDESCNDGIWKPRNGSRLPSYKLQCFSVACLDMPHLEFGDKIVLPPRVLLELQCLKIPTPLLFMVQVGSIDIRILGDGYDRQYCSVQEFSAPDGQVFLPYWLMQNLRVSEGGSVIVSSVVNLPRGIYCRFQPETTSFLDLAASIGPKLLMETALRRYSVLSVNSTIVIEHGSVRYYVRVAELKPAPVISLCGDVDLETDFMSPEGFDPKRPPLGKTSALNDVTNMQSGADGQTVDAQVVANGVLNSSYDGTQSNNSAATNFGRRLKDGGYVERNQATEMSGSTVANSIVPRQIHSSALREAQKNIRNQQSRAVSTAGIATTAASSSSVLASQLRMAQGAFSTPGIVLGAAKESQSFKIAPEAVIVVDEPQPTEPLYIREEENSRIQSSSCNSPTAHRCELCLADISSANVELHMLRCVKNPAYHKVHNIYVLLTFILLAVMLTYCMMLSWRDQFECSKCREKILRLQEHQHQHCPDCTTVCESNEALAKHQQEEHNVSYRCTFCETLFTRTELQDHVDNHRCDHVLFPCPLCGLSFKKKDMTQHSQICSSRTERCDDCKTYIKITEFDAHRTQCEALLAPEHLPSTSHANLIANTASLLRTESSKQDSIECVYCVQHGFSSIADLEHHVTHNCSIAKAFTSSASNNQEEKEGEPEQDNTEVQPIAKYTRPILAQGRMRRKGDTTALSRSTPPDQESPNRGKRLPITSSLHMQPTQDLSTIFTSTSTFLPSSRPNQISGKHRKLKPKPSLQLRPLPPRTQSRIVEIETSQADRISSSRAISQSVSVGLSITGAKGTLQSVTAPPLRSRTNSRGKKKPANAFPSSQ